MPINLGRLDWKFFATLIFAIAGAAVPVLLWQLDLSSKALTLTVKSVAELQPQGIIDLDGIQVLMDGKPLTSPFVSVLELSNSGSKPIVASDFENPIRISAARPSTIARARQTSSTPPSLMPTLGLSEGNVFIQPLLLNPGDVIRFAFITANGKPQFSVQGRIAGVSEVSVSDATVGRDTRRYWLGTVVSTLLLSLYVVNIFEFAFAGLRRRIFLPGSLVKGLITGSGSALILVTQSSPESSTAFTENVQMVIASLIAAPYIFMNLWRESAA